MNLTDLRKKVKPAKNGKRKGRGPGSGNGKTAGRGTKGFHSRSGSGVRLWSESGQMPLYRRIPKRGFGNDRFASTSAAVNVSDLDRFDEGSEVTPEFIREKGVVKGRFDRLRILGRGEVTKKLTVRAHHFSASAREKLEKAGCTCEIIREKKHRPRGVGKDKSGKKKK